MSRASRLAPSFPEGRAREPAQPGAKNWLTAHNAPVMSVALVAVGTLLTGQGITGL